MRDGFILRDDGSRPGSGGAMTEPLFFDCLTDAQFWSLFDTGVLHGYRVPVEVYARLERIAPSHGCYVFAWPAGVASPSLPDIVAGLAMPGDTPPAPSANSKLQMSATLARVRAAIEAFCARIDPDMPAKGGRIHIIATHPRPELRVGPCLEPWPRDLSAMSLPELEAYLDEVLRLDEGE